MLKELRIGDYIAKSDKSNTDFSREILEFAIDKGFIWSEEIVDDENFWADAELEAINYLNNGNDCFNFYCYWGVSDDGENFGLYPCVEDAKESCDFVSSRINEWPGDNYQGVYLHINDHGNCSLYNRIEGTDNEIWSVV